MVAPRSLIGPWLLVFSVSVGAGAAAAAECVALDDFSQGLLGKFPPEWKPRKESGRLVYSIREEGGRRFLRGIARRIGIQAGREVSWSLEAYPILAWSWRPVEFPKDSDERKAGANDSAVSVYAVFPNAAVSVKSVKYVWSRVVPVGTHLTSSGGNTQVRVLRSGPAPAGQWVDEQVNVRDDYHGDYAGFRVCKP